MSFGLDFSQITTLLQLASPALPIGAFSYSQGLEAAIDHEAIRDAASVERWIGESMCTTLAACELPIWAMQYRNWQARDWNALRTWNDWFLASRETRELRLETEQMGWSLAQLMQKLEGGDRDSRQMLDAIAPVSLPTAYSWAAVARNLPIEAGLTAYCFGWAENQVSAAVKALPLGQVAGQRILDALRGCVAIAVAEALERAGGDESGPRLSTLTPMLAILSSRHETQYSRLFRS
jgi:urease accessory protein